MPNKKSYEKIWITYTNFSRGRRSKLKVYNSESELLINLPNSNHLDHPNIPNSENTILMEFELKSEQTVASFLKSIERDFDIRNALDDLEPHEINSQELINLFTSIGEESRTKSNILKKLNKIKTDKKVFTSYLAKNKKYFLTYSDDVEWIIAILKCHNFRDASYYTYKYDIVSRKHIKIDNASENLHKNFKIAKLKLKNNHG